MLPQTADPSAAPLDMNPMAARPDDYDEWIGRSAEEYLVGLADGFFNAEYESKFERDRAAYRCQMFYDGKQYLRMGISSKWWEELEVKGSNGEIFWIDNQFKFYTDSNAKEFVRGRTELQVRPASNNEEQIEGARNGSAVWRHFQDQLFTEDVLQREGVRSQLDGEVWRYFYWDPNAGPWVEEDDEEQITDSEPSEFHCQACDTQGTADHLEDHEHQVPATSPVGAAPNGMPSVLRLPQGMGMQSSAPMPPAPGTPAPGISAPGAPAGPAPFSADDALAAPDDVQTPELEGPADPMETEMRKACPVCGAHDERLKVYQFPEIKTAFTKGTKKRRRAGSVKMASPSIFEMWCNSDATDRDSIYWVRRYRIVDRAQVYRLYGAAVRSKLKTASMLTSLDRGPWYKARIESNFGGAGTPAWRQTHEDGMGRKVELAEDWFKPEVYCEYIATYDHPVYEGGPIIKDGQRLSDVFPDGIRIARSGKSILHVCNESLLDRWVHIPFRVRGGSIHGAGVHDACVIQEQLNELVSLLMTNVLACAAPITLYNLKALGDLGISGSPNRLIPITELPYGVSIKEVIEVIAGTPLPGEVWAAIKMMLEHMQMVFGAFSSYSGIPDQRVDTAAGMSMLREAAAALIGMSLALRAAGDKESCRIVLKLFKDNDTSGRAVKYGGNYSEPEWLHLKGADIEEDYDITAKPGSWSPREEFQLRQDLKEWLEAMGMVQQLGPDFYNPTMLGVIAERWAVPDELNEPMISTRAARAEFMAAKTLTLEIQNAAGKMGQEVLPEEIVAQVLQIVKPRRQIDNHEQMISYLKNYGRTDQGVKEPPIVQVLLEELILEHKTAFAEEQAQDQAIMAGSMMPVQNAVAANQIQQNAAAEAAAPQGNAPGKTGGPSPQRQPSTAGVSKPKGPIAHMSKAPASSPAPAQAPVG